jgi:hypothetical protein
MITYKQPTLVPKVSQKYPKGILTPKGERSFFSKKSSNLPFLVQEAQMKKLKLKKMQFLL